MGRGGGGRAYYRKPSISLAIASSLLQVQTRSVEKSLQIIRLLSSFDKKRKCERVYNFFRLKGIGMEEESWLETVEN